MKYLLKLLLVFILISTIPLCVQAKNIKYNHNSITISEVEKKVDFKVLSPKQVPKDWTLEIKTYPLGEKDTITNFRLHYMDKNDKYLMVGIEQRKAVSNEVEVKTPNAEKININGHIAYFQGWGNGGEGDSKGKKITGGLLTWIQDGTYIEMDSSNISKENMMKIANSLK
ncbi:DUF4367 domain-containing protein [Bacillus sp. HMF5848]|uniref:DUF4367 domain-containing protein n=1 Tax=Bacillus sp. HMF5848 TaxID=2495421 RepID=UPI000F76A205|nr:DUF4367 domain-containing protein [Bacillus sp. HMF5848]RSK28512.1 DUF4367 domain-containing protein [Bacillus sp. HMF5848]